MYTYIHVVGYASNPLNIDDSFRVGRARGYCNDYEDEDELKLNSAQHARSAASRLDDVIDRSALEQAREGLGGRDIEEPLIGLEVQKSTLEWCETVVYLHHAINAVIKIITHMRNKFL